MLKLKSENTLCILMPLAYEIAKKQVIVLIIFASITDILKKAKAIQKR